MKALFHTVLFVLSCLGAYYISKIIQAPATQPSKEPQGLFRGRVVQEEKMNSVPIPAPAKEQPASPQGLSDLKEAPEEQEAQEEQEVQDTPAGEALLPNSLSRGWGENVDWEDSYTDALKKAKTDNKPLMVIHHGEKCPFSLGLKTAFSVHEGIQKLAREDFVMFNLMTETADPNLAPDGYYVPRIIFIDPSLVVRTDIQGRRDPYRYTYTQEDVELLMENMKEARITLKSEL